MAAPSTGTELVPSPQEAHRDQDGDESPGKRSAASNPDLELDRLLAKRRMESSGDVPTWAGDLVSLQQNMVAQMAEMNRTLHGFQTRVENIESQQGPQRMANMEDQIRELKQLVMNMQQQQQQQQQSGGSQAKSAPHIPLRFSMPTPPPPPRRENPPTAHHMFPNLADDTDYNHIICGGWPEDSKRKIIEGDTWELCKQFEGVIPEKVVVYGSRAQVSHIFLPSLDTLQARERFYQLQAKHSKKIQSKVGGEPIWMSPNRSPGRRAMNRGTQAALAKLRDVLGEQASDRIDTNYVKQIIWFGDRRVAATSGALVRAQGDERVVCVIVGEPMSEQHTFYFNVSVLAASLSKDVGLVEADLQSTR